MKKYLFILPLLFILSSCSDNTLSGKKYYLLHPQVTGLSATLYEFELNFLNDNKVEIKVTLNGYLDALQTYKTDPPVESESKIHDYTYHDGFLEIPDLKINSKLESDGNGAFITNNNEILYTSSIVEILDTDEANQRVIKSSPMASLNDIFLKMLHSSTGSKIVEKDGKLIIQ